MKPVIARRVAQQSWMLVCCLALSGCTQAGWRPQALTPEQLAKDKSRENLQLTLRNGTTLMAHYPLLAGDTLTWVGRPDGKTAAAGDSVIRFAIPVTDIRSIQEWHNQSNGVLLLTGFALLVLLAIASRGSTL